MTVTSLHFILFFCIVFILYYAVNPQIRWIVLLAAGCYFYFSWSPWALFLFAVLTLGNFCVAKSIACTSSSSNGLIFAFGLGAILGTLIVFKYLNFIFDSIALGLSSLDISFTAPHWVIAAPIGISFYAFQSIAYLIDVKQGTQKQENHFGKLVLFFSFFPIVSSGPIERAKNLLPQFAHRHEFDLEAVRLGFKRMAWGAFKKLVIADRLAAYVGPVFDHPSEFSGFPAMLAVIFFAFQLYCDFSGYSDIVIGAAKTLGYDLIENFRSPYFSTSIQHFWNRWHISLSTWLRDYIFFPLRRNLSRKKEMPHWVVQFAPILVTMFISGIWHGANWTFVLWGVLFGFYLAVENRIKPLIDKRVECIGLRLMSNLYSALQMVLTFSLVSFSWIFFRSNSIADAFTMIKNIAILDLGFYANVVLSGNWSSLLNQFIFDGGLNQFDFLFSLILIVFLLIFEAVHTRVDLFASMDRLPLVVRWTTYLMALFTILLFSADASNQNFIYFQF